MVDFAAALAKSNHKDDIGEALDAFYNIDDCNDVSETIQKLVQGGQDLAFEVSSWTREMAVNELQQGGSYADATRNLPQPAAGFSREAFASLYGMDPKLEEQDREPWAETMHGVMNDLPEWKALKRAAAGNQWASGVGAAAAIRCVTKQLRDQFKDVDVEREADVDEIAEVLKKNHPLTQYDLDWVKDQKAAIQKLNGYLQKDSSKAMLEATMAEAAIGAMDEIREMKLAMAAFGAGETGSLGGELGKQKAEVMRAIQRNGKIKRIAALAGRFEAVANSMRRSDDGKQREEVTGVTFGSELGLMLPQYRSMPRMLLAKRYKDGQLPQWKFSGSEKEKGPIIIVIDESDSMLDSAGRVTRIEMAKALLLTLMQTCIIQNRPFGFVRFSTGDQIIELFRDPTIARLDDLLHHLESFKGGGTRTADALIMAQSMADELGNGADIVLVTDGQDSWRPEVFNHPSKIHGIAIGCDFSKGQMDRLSSCVQLLDVDLDNAEAKIGVVLGL